MLEMIPDLYYKQLHDELLVWHKGYEAAELEKKVEQATKKPKIQRVLVTGLVKKRQAEEVFEQRQKKPQFKRQ